jgi:hypothetical protein
MRQPWIRVFASSVLIGLALMIATGPGDAHHAVLRFNLEEMTVTADRIFVGTCVAVEESVNTIAQGEMPVTSYTFEVERVVKGRLPRRLTFRQLGHPSHRAIGKGGELTSHGQAVNADRFIHGMGEYRPGDRVLLFLIPNYLGGRITYPVGLYQGAFFISRMPSGRELARNGINNLGLFTANYNGTAMARANARLIFPERDKPLPEAQGLSAATQQLSVKRGALPLDALLELVDRINIAHGGERGRVASTPKGGVIQ